MVHAIALGVATWLALMVVCPIAATKAMGEQITLQAFLAGLSVAVALWPW